MLVIKKLVEHTILHNSLITTIYPPSKSITFYLEFDMEITRNGMVLPVSFHLSQHTTQLSPSLYFLVSDYFHCRRITLYGVALKKQAVYVQACHTLATLVTPRHHANVATSISIKTMYARNCWK